LQTCPGGSPGRAVQTDGWVLKLEGQAVAARAIAARAAGTDAASIPRALRQDGPGAESGAEGDNRDDGQDDQAAGDESTGFHGVCSFSGCFRLVTINRSFICL
jgi:hypothetical protein